MFDHLDYIYSGLPLILDKPYQVLHTTIPSSQSLVIWAYKVASKPVMALEYIQWDCKLKSLNP